MFGSPFSLVVMERRPVWSKLILRGRGQCHSQTAVEECAFSCWTVGTGALCEVSTAGLEELSLLLLFPLRYDDVGGGSVR